MGIAVPVFGILVSALVSIGPWRDSEPADDRTANTAAPLTGGPAGSGSPGPSTTRSPDRAAQTEPQIIAATTVVLERGEAADADAEDGTDWSLEDFGTLGWVDFQVTDDPTGPSVLTGTGSASLAKVGTSDWATCGDPVGFANEELTAESLSSGSQLCGITGEGRRSALLVQGVRSDSARELTSVTLKITTWDTP